MIKIYRLKSTWTMYILLAVIIIGATFIVKAYGDNITYEEDTWRQTLEDENAELIEKMLDSPIWNTLIQR